MIGTFHYIFQFLAHFAEEEHSIMRFYYVSYTTAVSFTMNKFFKVVDVKREAAVILYVYIVCTYILCGAKLKIRRTHMRASKIDIFQKTTCFKCLQ